MACQIGTAMAARTQHASLLQVGVFTNRLLLWGIAYEIVFAAAVVIVPPLQGVFGTATPDLWQVLFILPFPVMVWGVDELWRWNTRRRLGLQPQSFSRTGDVALHAAGDQPVEWVDHRPAEVPGQASGVEERPLPEQGTG